MWTHLLRHYAKAFLWMSHPTCNGSGFSSKYAYGMFKMMHRHALIIAARFEHQTRLGCLHKPIHQLVPTPAPPKSRRPGIFPAVVQCLWKCLSSLTSKLPTLGVIQQRLLLAPSVVTQLLLAVPVSQASLGHKGDLPLSPVRVSPQCTLTPPHCFSQPCLPASQSREGLML